jgi:hypothetical protein
MRGWRNKNTLREIQLNIKRQLFENGRTIPISDVDRDRIMGGNEIMSIFYKIVDNDDSLKEKAKIVRSNGLFWTSTADVAVISIIYLHHHLCSSHEVFIRTDRPNSRIDWLIFGVYHQLQLDDTRS